MAEMTREVIKDFRPGIHQITSPNTVSGAAQDVGTYRCHASDSGSLIPLPAQTAVISHSLLSANVLLSEEYRITGLFVNNPVFYEPEASPGIHQNNSELYVGFEWWDNSGPAGADAINTSVERYKRNYSINPVWELLHSRKTTQPFEADIRPRKTEFTAIRSNNANPNVGGPMVIAWVCSGVAQFFPNDLATTVNGVVNLPGDVIDDASSAGLVFVDGLVAHQGRVVIFPATFLSVGANQVYATNEAFFWTRVNNIRVLDNTIVGGYFKAITSYDNPTGYQVYESLTSNELLLIKAKGGGMIVSENLNDYRVRNLPYVRGTGHSMNRGTVSPRGFIYPTDGGGVWLWEGGDVSSHITKHLVPDFWRPPPFSPASEPSTTVNEWGYAQTQSCDWNQFVMLPNNWLWDTDYDGWWKITNNDDLVVHRWASDWAGHICYGTPSGFNSITDPVVYEFTKTIPASDFSWKSHPLSPSVERTGIIREIIIVAEGDGEVEVIVRSAQNPTGQNHTLSIDPLLVPSVQAISFGVQGSHHTIQVISTATVPGDPAPTIHEIRYGFIEDKLVVRPV